ncbi:MULTISPECIES: NADH-quinone oxidoreductase subunit NuoN [Actinomycetes]|uniref:NADH-quinone oxidoreductase subunit NuoN n=1 Tax=Actinomycetes TaxID=1760 RepID=UPI000959A498|nr:MULTISPECIES: NADH-quinone oxidoreductase subunit NuoN [Actinomycetes]MBN9096751.1 NADH-quinone oxidoreductase subunit NuoN [Pseudonocardia sp.]OJY52489.1 MAG: NADH-quinone oxidoreductase subunit N [Pseudonocardia sp. 73-21]
MSILAQQAQLTAPPIDYGAVAPLLIILGAACVAVLIEAFLPRHQRWPAQVVLSIVALVAAGLALALYAGNSGPEGITTISDALAVDRPTLFLWGTLLALGLGSILLIADRSVEPGGAFLASAASRAAVGGGGGGVATGGGVGGGDPDPDRGYGSPDQAPTMQTEVFPFTLFALAGMMTFCAANDLLTMFIALEVLSLPLYLMCGLARRRRLLSQEAAVKYFLLGAFASAFFLYGLALLYGYAGSVRFSEIAAASAGSQKSDALLLGGLGLLVVGLMFKASVGPFHTWTPDVYQGAPTPVTAFMGACTKVAAFGGILRVLYVAFGDTRWEWRGVLWAVAIASMVIGAVIGLTQTDVKRMIAYSSVAHAGFLLLGAMSITAAGTSGTLFYLLAYGFTTLAVFGVISLVRGPDGEATHLSQWAGLAKRSPVVAAVMSFLLLALAGIPLTSGFTAKFAVFSAASADGMVPLVVIALIASAVAAFFYVRVIVLMYFSEPAPDGPTVTVPGAFTTAAITLGVLVTLLLGIVPTLALGWAGAGTFVG